MIEDCAENSIVLLHGRASTYAVGAAADGRWISLYWGDRLRPDDVFHADSAAHRALIGDDDEEYPGWAGPHYGEPALKATFPGGVRDVRLRYQAHRIDGTTLEVTLTDETYALACRLVYRLHDQWDIVERMAVLENRGPAPVIVEQAFTGVAHIPWQPSYRLTHLAGRWGEETLRQRQDVPFTTIVLESRRGHTGPQHAPWLAIDRVDLGILRYTDQVWTTDNTFAQDRLTIQEGFTYAYAPKVQVAWVTDNDGGRLAPLRYRFHVAMQGMLGIGGNLLAWSEADMAQARELVALYKDVRPIIQHGHLYRLLSAAEGGDTAVWYTSPDGTEGVAFAYRTSAPPWAAPIRLRLPGLQEGHYRVELPDGTRDTRSASGLAASGVMVPLTGDFVSAIVRVYRA